MKMILKVMKTSIIFFKARFARKITDKNFLRIEKSGYSIYFRMLDKMPESRSAMNVEAQIDSAPFTLRVEDTEENANLESCIKYSEIYNGIDLEYVIKADRIKENITIRKRRQNYDFAYAISAKGLVLELDTKTGAINYYSGEDLGKGAPVFTMPAPYMFDAAGHMSYSVKYALEQIDEGEYILYVIPDTEWINGDCIAFPVVIDPTVVVWNVEEKELYYKMVQNKESPLYGKQTTFYAPNGKYNNFVCLGYRNDSGSLGDGETWLYVSFAGLGKNTDKEIRSINLRLNLMIDSNADNAPSYFVAKGIKENESWWAKPNDFDWNGRSKNESSNYFAIAKPIKKYSDWYMDFDVTAVFRAGYTGVVIKGHNSGVRHNFIYVSPYGGSAIFSIVYGDNGQAIGGKSITQSCNRAGSGAIDLFSGALHFEHRDLSLDGMQLPINISHIYNSYDYNKEADSTYKCGAGWRLNFLQTLKKASPLVGDFDATSAAVCYEYTDAYGRKQDLATRYFRYIAASGVKEKIKQYCSFIPDKNGSSQQPPQSEISNETFVLLQESKGGKSYNVLKDEKGDKLWFDGGTGRLRYVTAANNTHELEINYVTTSKIELRDNYNSSLKRSVTLNFASNYLSSIVYDGKTICTFEYATIAGRKQLSKIIYGAATQNYSEYNYNSSYGNLYKVTDPAGYTVEYKQTFNRVPKITGYKVNTKTESISYDDDENKGITEGNKEYIAEDITITYNDTMREGNSNYSSLPMDNLTTVRNAAGAENYYSFRSDGMLQLSLDGKGNRQVSQAHINTEDVAAIKESGGRCFYYKTISHLSSATVIETAPAFLNKTYSKYDGFVAANFNQKQIKDCGTYTGLEGGIVFIGYLSGNVVPNGSFSDLTEAYQNGMPYTALKAEITYTDSSSAETKFALFDGVSSGEDKRLMAVLPVVVDKDKVKSVKLTVESFGNPNAALVDSVVAYNAKSVTEVTIDDKDKAYIKTCNWGQTINSVESDITGKSAGDINGVSGIVLKTTTTSRGTQKQTSLSYYDGSQRLIKTIDGLGVITECSYGSGNNKPYVTMEKVTVGSENMTKKYTYASSSSLADNILASSTDETGSTVSSSYNNLAQLSAITLPGTNQKINYSYNGAEGLLKEIKASANSAANVEETANKFYYNRGYLTRVKHDSCTYDFTYDGFGRITCVSVGDKPIAKTAYTVNGTDIDGVSGATSKVVSAYYSKYDIEREVVGEDVSKCGGIFCGQIYATSNILGQPFVSFLNDVYASYYDKNGELIKVRSVVNHDIDKPITYGDYISIVTEDRADARYVNYRVIGINYNGTDIVYEYRYNCITGELLGVTEYSDSIPKVQYIKINDDFGRTKAERHTLDNGQSLTYTYTYKSAFEDTVSSIKLPNGKTAAFTFDDFGRLKTRSVNTSSALQNEYTYCNNRTDSSSTTPLVSKESLIVGNLPNDYSYTYDSNNNILTIKNGSNTLLVSYEYDGLNRLIRENIVGGNTTVFKYDKGGNLQYKKVYAYSAAAGKTYTDLLNGTGKTISYGYGVAANKDLLTSYNGSGTLEYDNYGNPQKWFKHGASGSSLGYTLQWGSDDRLVMVEDVAARDIYTYIYNDQGIRISKFVNDVMHTYYLQGEQIIAEIYGNNFLKFYYDSTGICGFNYNGTDYYYQKNIQGDILKIFDGNGTLYAEYSYDAWGKCTIKTNVNGIAKINPFRYRGYYLDDETGLYYLNARYYDPEIGRFISPDSIEYLSPETINGLNVYAYCLNNPVMYTDPSGTIILTLLIMGLVGATVSAVSSIVSQAVTNNGEINWGLVALETLIGGISGLFSVAPIGFIGQGLINAGLSMVTYFVGAAIAGAEISPLGAISSIGLGFITGLLGGDGILYGTSWRSFSQMEHTFIKNIINGKGLLNSIINQSKTFLGTIYKASVKETLQISIFSFGSSLIINGFEFITKKWRGN